MTFQFGEEEKYHTERYDGWYDPGYHLIACQAMWNSIPKDEWVHDFFHMLDEMPQSWYVLVELCRDITTWEKLMICFNHTFIFEDTNLAIHSALQHI